MVRVRVRVRAGIRARVRLGAKEVTLGAVCGHVETDDHHVTRAVYRVPVVGVVPG